MTSTGINNSRNRAKYDFRAYAWLPETVTTSYSPTTKGQVLTYPQARTISETRFSTPEHGKNILPILGGANSVPESEISFSSFSVLVDARAYPRVLRYMELALRVSLNGMCSLKNYGKEDL